MDKKGSDSSNVALGRISKNRNSYPLAPVIKEQGVRITLFAAKLRLATSESHAQSTH